MARGSQRHNILLLDGRTEPVFNMQIFAGSRATLPNTKQLSLWDARVNHFFLEKLTREQEIAADSFRPPKRELEPIGCP